MFTNNDREKLFCAVCNRYMDEWLNSRESLIRMSNHISVHRKKREEMIRKLSLSLESEIDYLWLILGKRNKIHIQRECMVTIRSLINSIEAWNSIQPIPVYFQSYQDPFYHIPPRWSYRKDTIF